MKIKTAVQIDFDGTVTLEDVSYLLLDTYADPSWRDILAEYSSGKIPVGTFNRRVFSLVKADRETMLKKVLSSDRVKIRDGFHEFIAFCKSRGFKVSIVSNGLEFYVRAILDNLGITGVKMYAAENEFYPGGVRVRYVGLDGQESEEGLKEAHVRHMREQGFDIIYIGNGESDIFPARIADKVFATEDLLAKCREEGLSCTEFNTFFDIIDDLKGSH